MVRLAAEPRGWRTRSLALLALVILAGDPARGGSLGKGRWVRAETDHVVVLSNAKPDEAAEIAVRMERLRRVLAHEVPGFDFTPTRTQLFVFRNRRSFEAFAGTGGAGGYYRQTPYESYLASRAQDASRESRFPYRDLYHEFVHHLTAGALPNMPVWLCEGMAEYYSTFTVDEERAEFGRPVESTLALLRARQRWIPLPRLLAASYPDDALLIATPMFYAQSWAVVHYLLHGNDRRRAEFSRYFECLQRGMPQRLAFERSFSVDENALLGEVRAHVLGDGLPFGWVEATRLDLTVAPRLSVLRREEKRSHLGLLLIHVFPSRTTEAERLFRAALGADPESAAARYGLGLVEETRGNLLAAREHLERAAALAPGEPLYALRLGHVRLQLVDAERGSTAPGSREQLAACRRALRDSIALGADGTQAYLELGASYLYDAASSDEGVAALERAWTLAPGRAAIPATLTLLQLERGESDRARQTMLRALGMYPYRFVGEWLHTASPRLRTTLRAIDLLAELITSRPPHPGLPDHCDWSDLAPELAAVRTTTLSVVAGETSTRKD